MTPPPPPGLVAQAHLAERRNAERPDGAVATLGFFALTAAVFVGTAGWLWGVDVLPWIVITLLVHELGHWLAMRVFGYRNTKIFFLPFFGAATAGRKDDAPLWQEAIVLLSGPLPGIVLGVVVAILDVAPTLAAMLIAINGLNLLPFLPLDGGRLVHRALAPGPTLDVGLRGAAAMAFLAIGIAGRDLLFGGLGVVLLLGLRSAYALANEAKELQDRVEVPKEPLDRLRVLHEHLGSADEPLPHRIARVDAVEQRLGRGRDPLIARVAVGAVYMLAFFGSFAAAIFGFAFIVRSPDPVPCAELDGHFDHLTGERELRCEPRNEDAVAYLRGHALLRCDPFEELEGSAAIERGLAEDFVVALGRQSLARDDWEAPAGEDAEALGEWLASARSSALDGRLPEVARAALLDGDEAAWELLGTRLGCDDEVAYDDAPVSLAIEDVPSGRAAEQMCALGCERVGVAPRGL